MLRDASEYEVKATSRGLLVPGVGDGASWAAVLHWKQPGPPPIPVRGKDASRTAAVRVERGMWIVDCVCGGAQLACRTDHRVFCCDCGNAPDGGKWVRVNWPDRATLVEIEAALLSRPPYNRNWSPGETVDDLLAENVANGWAGN